MRKKAVIFGAGEYGQLFLKTDPEDIEIIGFIDNDRLKQGMMVQGLPVLSPDHILTGKAEVVCIASSYAKEILDQLTNEIRVPNSMIRMVSIDEVKTSIARPSRDELRQQLEKLTKLFELNGIQWWLDHSSLLHLLRSGEFINGLDDVDLCILSHDAEKVGPLVAEHFSDEEIKMLRFSTSKTTKYWSAGDLAHIRIGTGLDIQIKYIKEDAVFWHVDPFVLSSSSHYYTDSVDCEYAGMHLRLPVMPESYLVQMYGDWKTPKQGWTYDDYLNIVSRFSFSS